VKNDSLEIAQIGTLWINELTMESVSWLETEPRTNGNASLKAMKQSQLRMAHPIDASRIERFWRLINTKGNVNLLVLKADIVTQSGD
jgi:hypothetical protein